MVEIQTTCIERTSDSLPQLLHHLHHIFMSHLECAPIKLNRLLTDPLLSHIRIVESLPRAKLPRNGKVYQDAFAADSASVISTKV